MAAGLLLLRCCWWSWSYCVNVGSVYICSGSFPTFHRTSLPPWSGPNRASFFLLLPQTFLGSREPFPQRHPREESFAPPGLQRVPRRLSGRRPGRHPKENKGRPGIRRPEQLSPSRSSEVPVPLWRCHETPGSAGQWEAGAGQRLRRRGVRSLRGLQARGQRPSCCFCQAFCLQISGEIWFLAYFVTQTHCSFFARLTGNSREQTLWWQSHKQKIHLKKPLANFL